MARIAVALSGGVDSAVAGLMCKEEGHEVIGVTLYLYEGQEESINRAREIARALEIEHHIFDVRDKFRKKIVRSFIESYKAGLTPNPCALCNRLIKFDLLLRFARENLKADFLATGHYVSKEVFRGYLTLRTPRNVKKDQSYFLALVKRNSLNYALFPLSTFNSKEEVKALARSKGLPLTEERESQDVCFLKGESLEEFLTKHLGIEEGEIIFQGKVVGKHRGYYFYTIGQRKGLGLPLGKVLYVTAIDPKHNRIILGEKEQLERDYLYLQGDLNFFVPLEYWSAPTAQIRYRTERVEVKDLVFDGGRWKLRLKNRVRGVTPGQICAFYEEGYLLGGGIIGPYDLEEFSKA